MTDTPVSKNKPQNHNYFLLKSTADSIVEMGKVNMDGIISAFKVTAATDHPVPHYFQMDKTGSSKTSPRKGGTIFRGPGTFQIKHGDGVEKEIPGVYIDSGNGDMILISQGRIRMIAEDIDLIATGGGGEHGVITVNANEKILAHSKGAINVKAHADFQLHTSKKGRVIGMGGLELFGGNHGPSLMSSDEVAITASGTKGFSIPWKSPSQAALGFNLITNIFGG